MSYSLYLYEFYLRHKDLETWSDFELLKILQARRSPTIVKLQAKVFQEVLRRYSAPPLAERPLTEGVQLAYAGQTTFKIKALRKRLAAQGVSLVRTLEAPTTHVLVGPKLSDLAPLKGKTLLLDADVQRFLDQTEQPYLQQAEYADAEEHLGDLLLSQDEDQQQVAAAMLEGGGFVPGILPHTFVAAKTTDHKAFRKQLNTYLKRYLHPNCQGAVSKTARLVSDSDQYVTKNLKQYAKLLALAPEGAPGAISGLDIARLLFAARRKGYLYLFEYETDPQRLVPVLRHFVDAEGRLDLSGRYLKHLPDAVGLLKGVHTLDLSHSAGLRRLPMGLTQMEDLKELHLSQTGVANLSILPQTSVTTLHFRSAYLYDTQLRYLRKLDTLHLSRYLALYCERSDGLDVMRPDEVPAYLPTVLPHVQLVWH